MTKDINGSFVLHFVADAAGGTLIMSSLGISKAGKATADCFLQVKGVVSASYTLCERSLFESDDSTVQAAVVWDGPVVVTPLTIASIGKAFTGLRLVMAAGAEAHLSSN